MSEASDTRTPEHSGKPLAGVSVLVTRTREQSAALAGPLETLGAEVVAMPVIEVADPVNGAPLEAALDRLETYDWVILTSVNAVKRLFARLAARGAVAIDVLRGLKVAAVGSATAAGLRARGVEPDLVPKDFRAEGIVEAFGELGIGAGTRVLIPRAAEAREVLPERLTALGAEVDAVDLYRLVPIAADPTVVERLERGEIDVITFASGATARHFVTALETAGIDPAAILGKTAVASVGPVTTAGIRKLGYEVDVEAATSTMESLVAAIAAHVGASGTS